MSDPADIPTAAVLDYATFDADGLPAWVPEAERLIDLRQPPRAIRKFFLNGREATKYFSKSMRRRFGVSKLDDVCTGCGKSPCPTAAAVEWAAEMSPRTFEFALSSQSPVATFITYHCLCKTCGTRWVRSLQFLQIATFVFSTLRWFWVAVIIFLAYWTAGPNSKPTLSFWRACWPIYFVVIFSAGRIIREGSRRFVPIGMSRTLPPKVDLRKLHAFDLRENMIALPGEVPSTSQERA